MIDHATVVIRGAHERTEVVCFELVKEQFPAERIILIHERPFTTALRRSFEIGIERGMEWTLCLDADVLIRQRAISDLLEAVSALPADTLGGSGYVFDKLRDGRRPGGLHLYRTSLLPHALSFIPAPSSALRPETHVKQCMESSGHPWKLLDMTLGLHDFEQFYSDIFRKALVRARKSSSLNETMLRKALLQAKSDTDFLVVSWGMRVGMNLTDQIDLDSKQWASEANILLLANDMREKNEMKIEQGRILVEKLYANLSLQQSSRLQVDGTLQSDKRNRIFAWVWKLGWWITQFGTRVQMAGFRRIH